MVAWLGSMVWLAIAQHDIHGRAHRADGCANLDGRAGRDAFGDCGPAFVVNITRSGLVTAGTECSHSPWLHISQGRGEFKCSSECSSWYSRRHVGDRSADANPGGGR
jgi:hypothetical protein